jgi:hypothetical protein
LADYPVSRLVKVPFENLKSGMSVSKPDLKVYEVLVADRVQAIMMKDKKTACVITAAEYAKDDWFTVVKGHTRRKHGQG